MSALLAVSAGIDRLNDRFGTIANWLVLLAVLVSAGNACMRYAFSMSSNGWIEIQWYMFAGVVMLGASYTLKVNEHVRVDLVYANAGERGRLWIDILGLLLFLIPMTAVLALLSWPLFKRSWDIQEMSMNAGGLILWPVKLLMPLGFALLTAQGVSELIKRIAALRGRYRVETRYERPLQ